MPSELAWVSRRLSSLEISRHPGLICNGGSELLPVRTPICAIKSSRLIQLSKRTAVRRIDSEPELVATFSKGRWEEYESDSVVGFTSKHLS